MTPRPQPTITPMTPRPQPTITHYYAVRNPLTGRWHVLQKAIDSAGTHYSISGGTNGVRVVTAAEAESIQRTGKLPTQEGE